MQIAAIALVGLWSVQYRSLARHLAEGTCAPDRLHEAVTADVRRAAALLAGGIDTDIDTSVACGTDTGTTSGSETGLATPAGTGRTSPRTPVHPTVQNMPR